MPLATVSDARSGAPCGSGVCHRISSGPRVERGPRSARDHLTGRQRVGLSRVVTDGGVDAAAIHRGAPLNAAGVRAWTDQAAPEQPSRRRVERPVDAGLLADAHDPAPAVTDVRGEDVGPRPREVPHAEFIGRRTPRHLGRQAAAGKPARVGSSAAERPARFAGAEVEGDDGVEVRARREAALAPAVGLGGETCRHRLGLRVEVSRRADDETVLEINRRRVHERAAGKSAGHAEVVGQHVALPQDPAGVRIEREHAAPEHEARRRTAARRRIDEETMTEDDGRRRDDRVGIGIEPREPPQIAGRGVDAHHVAAEIAHVHHAAVQRRARPRDRAGDAVVAADRPRPDDLPGIGIELPQIAAPVRKIDHGAAMARFVPFDGDGRRCGDVASGLEGPRRLEPIDVAALDELFVRLTARVLDVVADHRPRHQRAPIRAQRPRADCKRHRDDSAEDCDCSSPHPSLLECLGGGANILRTRPIAGPVIG